MNFFFSFSDFLFFSFASVWILMGLLLSQFVKFGIFIIYFRYFPISLRHGLTIDISSKQLIFLLFFL